MKSDYSFTPQPPLQDIDHGPLADEQQEDDDAEHDLDPRQPRVGLLPALGADGLVHGDLPC
ncbi:MAG: hypothetical protein NT133_11085, partial [Alphaproteobacteria bacterium]|nr:hypothetical protein [Alphaproteobacteria bacterium]